MAVTSFPDEVPVATPLSRLEAALQSNDLEMLSELPSMEVSTELLITLLNHPLTEFRDWAWHSGGSKVVDTAIALIWGEHSLQLTCDFVARLGSQAFYESYFYQTSGEFNLSDTEFLWQVAPSIGYPDLRWAASTTDELLNLALRNPHIRTSYIQQVQRWAASSQETIVEAEILAKAIAQRRSRTH